LNTNSKPKWENILTNLANCITYELIYENKHSNSKKVLKKWMLKTFVKILLLMKNHIRRMVEQRLNFLTNEKILKNLKDRLNSEYYLKTQ
jgi:hypothetical protein